MINVTFDPKDPKDVKAVYQLLATIGAKIEEPTKPDLETPVEVPALETMPVTPEAAPATEPAAPIPEPTPTPEPPPAPEPATQLTKDDIIMRVKKLAAADRTNIASIKAILGEFGVAKVTDLGDDQLVEFDKRLKEIGG